MRTRVLAWLQLASSVLTRRVKVTVARGGDLWYLSTVCSLRVRREKTAQA